jgi:hypothetical protein
VLPAVVTNLPADRSGSGSPTVQMAGHLHLTYRQYLALEAGELEIDNELFERIVPVCGWPTGSAATRESPTQSGRAVIRPSRRRPVTYRATSRNDE